MEVLSTSNFQPDIVLWGLRIGEPMIALTSILVAVVSFYAWFRLQRSTSPSDATRLARIFFFLTGCSTLIGGLVGHAFLYWMPFAFKLPGWVLGMVAVSALEQASIVRAKPLIGTRLSKFFIWLNIIELTAVLWFVSSTLWFPAVEAHSAFGLLIVVAPLEAWLFFKTRDAGSRYILLAILLLVGAAAVHITKLSLGVWFGFFDIAHLLMCGAIWLFMRGAEVSQRPADLAIKNVDSDK